MSIDKELLLKRLKLTVDTSGCFDMVAYAKNMITEIESGRFDTSDALRKAVEAGKLLRKAVLDYFDEVPGAELRMHDLEGKFHRLANEALSQPTASGSVPESKPAQGEGEKCRHTTWNRYGNFDWKCEKCGILESQVNPPTPSATEPVDVIDWILTEVEEWVKKEHDSEPLHEIGQCRREVWEEVIYKLRQSKFLKVPEKLQSRDQERGGDSSEKH